MIKKLHASQPAWKAATEQRLEEAVLFLAVALSARRQRGKKPVVLHSLRVGHRLLALGYRTDVVVAGLLHDILEKTTLTQVDLSRRFGPEVAALVACVTKDRAIADPLARYGDSVKRCTNHSRAALAIRTVDLIDNCDRLTALFRVDRLQRIHNKLAMVAAAASERGLIGTLIDDLALRLQTASAAAPTSDAVSEGNSLPVAAGI